VPQGADEIGAGVRRRCDGIREDQPLRALDVDRMGDARLEERDRIRSWAGGPADIDRRAPAALRPQRARDDDIGQTRGFRFLRQGRRAEEPGPEGEPARPSAAAHERTDARTEERAVHAVVIQSSARRQREPPGHVQIVLGEDARDRERVVELRRIGLVLRRIRPRAATHVWRRLGSPLENAVS
jgi:hypothetical protein